VWRAERLGEHTGDGQKAFVYRRPSEAIRSRFGERASSSP
jgi:hypothetical protein